MSKIICDICGTTYPDSADSCPICGCSRDSAMDFLGDEFQTEQVGEEARPKKGRYSSGKKRKEIFDYDEVNTKLDEKEIPEEDEPEEEEEFRERPQSNTFAVIGLTVLIAALLLAAGFLFMRFILPNLGGEQPGPAQVYETMPAPETTGYQIPCTGLTLVSTATAELNQEGQYHLINVIATPEDTTDQITFYSGDESVATVSGDGRITAVSEGETTIYITCGKVQSECKVIVKFVEETEPPVEETQAPTEEPAAETEAPETAPAETEAPKADIKPDVELKLKKTDIRLGVYLSYRLELDCDLNPEDVEWSAEHEHIVSVDETGLVKALKTGVTDVIVRYGDQEVRCRVRCEKMS